MSRSRVTSIRLSEDELSRFKAIAESKGVDFNTLVREALSSYTGVKGRVQLPEYVERVLGEFKVKIDNYVNRVKEFCEEQAKIIVESHESERGKHDYWRDACLHRYRRLTRSNLKVYVQDVLYKQINTGALSKEEKEELERRISELVDYAVKNIFVSETPPAYPPL